MQIVLLIISDNIELNIHNMQYDCLNKNWMHRFFLKKSLRMNLFLKEIPLLFDSHKWPPLMEDENSARMVE